MLKVINEALTFDDVLLVPGRSEVLPRDVCLRTRLIRNLNLNIPLVAAAMDTVTEHKLAIAIAREGGVGIVHKNCTIDQQVSEIRQVKRAQSRVITKPITAAPVSSVAEVYGLMKKFNISSVPIVEHGKLVGIVTLSEIEFSRIQSNFDETEAVACIMIPRDQLTVGTPETTPTEAAAIFKKFRFKRLPLVDAEDNLKGLITVKDILKYVDFPLAAMDHKERLLVGAAIGAGGDYLERAQALIEAGVNFLCLDSAHGHSLGVIKATAEVKKKFSDLPLIVGNISTSRAAEELIDAGADTLKVGQGPGSICTTRVVTGSGMPQITAIMNVVEVAQKHDVAVIADGGIKYSGDIAKALAAGADTVMIGSLLAGTEESPGETLFINGQFCKSYRGMGSLAAMQKGSADRYFQEKASKLVPEGVEAAVPFRGTLKDVMVQLLGGLRAGMGMVGAPDIKSLWQAEFIRVTNAGAAESHPHGVQIVKEAPNYPGKGR